MLLVHWLMIGIVIAGVVAIFYVVLQKMGVVVPDFIVKIFWIIVACVVGILAIKLIVSLVGM